MRSIPCKGLHTCLHTHGYTGRARIIVNEDLHVIIGAILIGPQVGELLHPATVAIICEIPLERLMESLAISFFSTLLTKNMLAKNSCLLTAISSSAIT
jgi:pyruvate/2-oxoglutarate dehydrogenase complex dihydrolipoamide dehydrogenase (E3) component